MKSVYKAGIHGKSSLMFVLFQTKPTVAPIVCLFSPQTRQHVAHATLTDAIKLVPDLIDDCTRKCSEGHAVILCLQLLLVRNTEHNKIWVC